MKLSIITINYNNCEGLRKTMESVLTQTSQDFEYIVVDGGSTDGSKELIERLTINDKRLTKWVSEKDNGIYHAMNKGIRMAQGEYIQILNSSDTLVDNQVVEKMLTQFSILNSQFSILYGNMLKVVGNKLVCDKGFAGRQPTLFDFYQGTLNHSPVYIRRDLFEKYGYYDEQLKMASDWKWYVQAIVLGGEPLAYADIDVVYFDMTGVSSVNFEKAKAEKYEELSKMLPKTVFEDYKQYASHIEMMKRLKRHKVAYTFVWLLERMVFKLEKWTNSRTQIRK
jgi:glycosyltransferase involved in cell wall biosynthesis